MKISNLHEIYFDSMIDRRTNSNKELLVKKILENLKGGKCLTDRIGSNKKNIK